MDRKYLFTAILEDGTSYYSWAENIDELREVHKEIKKYLRDPWDYEAFYVKDVEHITLG